MLGCRSSSLSLMLVAGGCFSFHVKYIGWEDAPRDTTNIVTGAFYDSDTYSMTLFLGKAMLKPSRPIVVIPIS